MATTALLDSRIGALLDELASADPGPGAGAAAGLVLGMAAALCAMAARAAEGWADSSGAGAQAGSLRTRAARLAEKNAAAYAEALTALRVPDAVEDEARDFALGQALERAAEIPLALAEAAADVAELGAVVARDGQPAMRGDAVAASLLAAAVARAAAALVAVNLGVNPDDPRLEAVRSVARTASRSAERAERTLG